MVVGPLESLGNNAAISSVLSKVRLVLEKRVGRFEIASVQSGTVTDHDLGGVLVGHDDGGLGKLGAHSVRVVRHQGLLSHADVKVGLLSESFPK